MRSRAEEPGTPQVLAVVLLLVVVGTVWYVDSRFRRHAQEHRDGERAARAELDARAAAYAAAVTAEGSPGQADGVPLPSCPPPEAGPTPS